jgi:hypothetical protein
MAVHGAFCSTQRHISNPNFSWAGGTDCGHDIRKSGGHAGQQPYSPLQDTVIARKNGIHFIILDASIFIQKERSDSHDDLLRLSAHEKYICSMARHPIHITDGSQK